MGGRELCSLAAMTWVGKEMGQRVRGEGALSQVGSENNFTYFCPELINP